MKYIVYQTVCKVNNKIYIGVHGTTNPEIFDGYIGNGISIYKPSTYMNPKTPFQYAIKKYGIKSFIRTTLKIFENEVDAYDLERWLVDEQFLKREDTYNLILGGQSEVKNANPKKKIYMYDLDGNFEMEFDGVNEAGRYLNQKAKGAGHLSRAIKKGHQYLGHQFSYEKVPFMKKLRHLNRTSIEKPYIRKKVGKFDDNNNLLETFETMTDCVKAGYKNAKLVAQGKREHCKGFIFKYLD
jgi:hypothetical protein